MPKKRIHRVPHEAVRGILLKHGIDTVSKAQAFGDAHPDLSGKSIEGILRGKRKLGVEFARVDAILCALGDPMHWYDELAEWYYPPNRSTRRSSGSAPRSSAPASSSRERSR